MATSTNMPVLTLDFDEEQIAQLQQLADEFKKLQFLGPSGEAMPDGHTPPAPAAGDAAGGQNGNGEAGNGKNDRLAQELREFLNGTTGNNRKAVSTFKKVNAELRVTRQALGDLFSTAIKWGAAMAGLAAAGPLGYGLVANRVSSSVREAQGANVAPGTLQAAQAAYGPYFSNVTGAFSSLAAAQYDPSNELYAGLMALGLNPQDNPADNYPALLEKVGQLVDQYQDQGVALQYVNSLGLGSVVTPEVVNQVRANRENLPVMEQRYRDATSVNNNSLTADVYGGYQAVSSSLSRNADEVSNSFLRALSRLQGPIVDLSDELTDLVTSFIEGPNGEAVFDSIAEGLEQLATWLGSDEFRSDMREFGQDVSAAAKELRKFVEWLAGLFGQDGKELAAWGAGGAAAVGLLGGAATGGAIKASGRLATSAVGAAGAVVRFNPWTAAAGAVIPTNDTPTTDEEFKNAGVRPWWERNPPEFNADGSLVAPNVPTLPPASYDGMNATGARPEYESPTQRVEDDFTPLLGGEASEIDGEHRYEYGQNVNQTDQFVNQYGQNAHRNGQNAPQNRDFAHNDASYVPMATSERDRRRQERQARRERRRLAREQNPAGGYLESLQLDGYTGGAETGAYSPATDGTDRTRGFRNNNPGNLRYARQQGATRDADGYAVFSDRAAGIAALDRQLGLYLQRGTNTISSIVEKYAPRNENLTDNYKAFVSKQTGIDANEVIDRNDVASQAKIIRAIIDMEIGKDAKEVSTREINNAMQMRRNAPLVPTRDTTAIKIVQQPGSDYRAQVQSQTGGN